MTNIADNSSQRIVLRVGWRKALLITFGPLGAIILLAPAMSTRSMEDILTVENWTTPTITTPNPTLSLICLFLYLAMITWTIIWLTQAGGKYVWIRGDWLYVVNTKIAKIAELDPGGISVRGGPFGKLVLTEYSGNERIIRLAFAEYNTDKLISDLRSIIEGHDGSSG